MDDNSKMSLISKILQMLYCKSPRSAKSPFQQVHHHHFLNSLNIKSCSALTANAREKTLQVKKKNKKRGFAVISIKFKRRMMLKLEAMACFYNVATAFCLQMSAFEGLRQLHVNLVELTIQTRMGSWECSLKKTAVHKEAHLCL